MPRLPDPRSYVTTEVALEPADLFVQIEDST